MEDYSQTVLRFGGNPKSLVDLAAHSPDALPYATLTAARSAGDPDLVNLAAVYEWQDRPLIFLVDGEALDSDPEKIGRIRRIVAMRGDAPYLGVVTPGRLSVYSVGLEGDLSKAAVEVVQSDGDDAIVIPYLANLRPQLPKSSSWISDVILRLLTGALDDLSALGISDEDAISLSGRALFVRFLADRDLLPNSMVQNSPDGVVALFDTASSATSTSHWLDETFNGDFLPLSDQSVRALPPRAFQVLGNILRRAPSGQLMLGWQESWDRLDFAHIPVGVLSQAYERYLSHREPTKQHKEGGYYTPRHIADLMVQGSFATLRSEMELHKAKVLDPAAGAGVFLLTAFRELVAERWRHDNHRPDTKALRDILYNQITGFDINESALRFAALGLYLMSIELDPNPEPVEKLKFKDLRPRILRNLNDGRVSPEVDGLGSLGDAVGGSHRGAYDLVIGNPPWATSTKLPNWEKIQTRIRTTAAERTGQEDIRAPIPNEVLDLPFVWRAMEWARPKGQIAFALHARILFQRGETMPDARNALFGALDVTGIVNGTELRSTKVWPEISAPFCLLFARNSTPSPGSAFRFTSPHLERGLNKSGSWRIDASRAEIVSNQDARSRPEVLKILFRGTRLDLELIDRITANRFPCLGDYWNTTFGTFNGKGNFTGNGYQRLRPSSRKRKGSDLPGVSAEYLHGMAELTTDDPVQLHINTAKLSAFVAERIHDRRPKSIFFGPLLIVKESPPVTHARIRTSVSLQSVVYNQSFHGYSTHTHPDGIKFAQYLALVLGSKFALWHALVTSGRFGFEREVVEKFVLDEIPIPPFETLSAADRSKISELFEELAGAESDQLWQDVDQWVADKFNLTTDDLRVIGDTLRYHLPYSANVEEAQSPTSTHQRLEYSQFLADELKPWAERYSIPLKVDLMHSASNSPWCFVRIFKSDRRDGSHNSFSDFPIQWADELAATECVLQDDRLQQIILGRLNQARYWTFSQARLTARRLIWENIDFLAEADSNAD